MSKDVLVNVDDISVKYGQHLALSHIHFDINQGDFITLVGVNGSGKTTLAKSLLGLKRIASGRITWVNGQKVGYLPQHTGLENRHFPATVAEVVATGLIKDKGRHTWFNKDDRKRVKKMLKLFGMQDMAKKRIGNLSGGQQQRVLLARSMVMTPDLLILDEPTSALDQTSRDKFLKVLKKLNTEQNLTIILITHDVASIEGYANRVLYLDKHLLFDGSFKKFFETQPFSPFIHTHQPRYVKEGETS